MKKLSKTNQTEFRVEKAIKNTGELCVRWKDYDNSFKSWIN